MKIQAPYPKVYLYRRIVYAKLLIDNRFADRIDLDEIAGEAFFSKFHFIRLFRTHFKKTPHQYLSYVRIEKSKQLLKEDMAVSEVCYAVGFESISSFTALFKRMVLQTPAAFQLNEHQKREEIIKDPLKFIPNCFAEKKGWK